MTIIEMKEKRAALLEKAKELNSNENFDEVREEYDSTMAEVRKISNEIQAEERQNEINGYSNEAPKVDVESRENEDKEAKEFREYLMGERRDLIADGDDQTAGALVPTVYKDSIIKLNRNETPLFNAVSKLTLTNAGAVSFPYETNDAEAATWSGEIPASELQADNTWAFGRAEIIPHVLLKLIKVSRKLLATSNHAIETYVLDKLGQKYREAIEAAIVKGRGNAQNEPLGLFNDEKVAVKEVPVNITADSLIDIEMAMHPSARATSVWALSNQAIAAIRKLRDSNGRFLLESYNDSLADGPKLTLLGHEVIEVPEIAGGIAAGNKFGVFFNPKDYLVVTVDNYTINLMKEHFLTQGAYGFLLNAYASGELLNKQNAFVLKAAGKASSSN